MRREAAVVTREPQSRRNTHQMSRTHVSQRREGGLNWGWRKRSAASFPPLLSPSLQTSVHKGELGYLLKEI